MIQNTSLLVYNPFSISCRKIILKYSLLQVFLFVAMKYTLWNFQMIYFIMIWYIPSVFIIVNEYYINEKQFMQIQNVCDNNANILDLGII